MTVRPISSVLRIAPKADHRLAALTYFVPDHDARDGTTIDKVRAPVRDMLREVGDGKLPWPIFMSGGVGIGKSRAARMVRRHVMGSRAWDLAEWHGNTYADGGGNVWRMFRDPPLVVLDEVGRSESPTAAEAGTLHRCLNVREGKPFIVISNRTLEEIHQMYGDPIASRIDCGTTIDETQFGSTNRRPEG